MRITLLMLIALIAASCNNNSTTASTETKDSAQAPADAAEYGEMKNYWMVFLRKGPDRNQDSITAARIQVAHLANIGRLAKEGKIIMAGPMGDDKGILGIFIMDCKDSTEAASYIKTDSAVISGRLRFDIHPWWTAKGKYEFK